MVCVVRVEGTPYLCQTDEVGEICVSSGSTGVAYYGLPGMTKNVFEVSVLFLTLGVTKYAVHFFKYFVYNAYYQLILYIIHTSVRLYNSSG